MAEAEYLERVRERVRRGKAELPVIEAPGVKHARYMHRDDAKHTVLVAIWEDGSVTSCTFESDTEKEVQCCYTTEPGQEEAGWAWVAHLAGVGYKERHIEVEGEKAPQEPLLRSG